MEKSKERKKEAIWRKPIVLEEDIEIDPIDSLYNRNKTEIELLPKNVEEAEDKRTMSEENKIVNSIEVNTENKIRAKRISNIISPIENQQKKLTDLEIKKILRIKNNNFQFTDIREILRGKSLDIYVYLLKQSEENGFCKIKHSDLMNELDLSRPTLFKQSDWLIKLSLIEKNSVPGDHLGTSYKVFKINEVLEVPQRLINQIDNLINKVD